jgi:hypothetical protein
MAFLTRVRRASDTRLAAVALALVLAIVSMPMLSGIVMADCHCAITMDICHPIQPIDATPASLFAPPPQISSIVDAPRNTHQTIAHFHVASADRPAEEPDPPPPKIAG